MFLKKCCCYFDLRTGGIIQGWIFVIISFLFLISAIVLLNAPDFRYDNYGHQRVHLTDMSLIILVVLSGISLLFAALLIYGSMKENRYCLLPWIFAEAASIGFGAMTLFFMGSAIFMLIAVVITCGRVYLLACIYALYKQIKDNSNSATSRNISSAESQSLQPKPPGYQLQDIKN